MDLTTPEKSVFVRQSLVSLPIAWFVFQAYHEVICKPIASFTLFLFPQLSVYVKNPTMLLIASFNLLLFGGLALIWPSLGFGRAQKPDHYQSMVALCLVGVSLFIPALKLFSGWGEFNPFNEMGIAIWTISPIEEEILFRGFIYMFLLRFFHVTQESSWREALPAILLGAVWFSLWHFSPVAIAKYGWGVIGPQLLVTFVAGLIFNGLRHWTGNIWLGIPVHAAGNFAATLL